MQAAREIAARWHPRSSAGPRFGSGLGDARVGARLTRSLRTSLTATARLTARKKCGSIAVNRQVSGHGSCRSSRKTGRHRKRVLSSPRVDGHNRMGRCRPKRWSGFVGTRMLRRGRRGGKGPRGLAPARTSTRSRCAHPSRSNRRRNTRSHAARRDAVEDWRYRTAVLSPPGDTGMAARRVGPRGLGRGRKMTRLRQRSTFTGYQATAAFNIRYRRRWREAALNPYPQGIRLAFPRVIDSSQKYQQDDGSVCAKVLRNISVRTSEVVGRQRATVVTPSVAMCGLLRAGHTALVSSLRRESRARGNA